MVCSRVYVFMYVRNMYVLYYMYVLYCLYVIYASTQPCMYLCMLSM